MQNMPASTILTTPKKKKEKLICPGAPRKTRKFRVFMYINAGTVLFN